MPPDTPLLHLLIELHIVDGSALEPLFPRCRDRDDVSVWHCRRSGVIFLSRTDHITTQHYQGGGTQSYYGTSTRREALRQCAEDDTRRAQQFRELARNAEWLDVGTGLGGLLELLTPHCVEVVGVEPQAGLRQ